MRTINTLPIKSHIICLGWSINLIKRLLKQNYSICLETNGSKDIQPLKKKKNLLISLDIKCPSSKMEKKMYFENIKCLKNKDQLKFVIKDKKDYEYARSIIKRYSPGC